MAEAVLEVADMMICGRDSNTSSALGNAIIANAKCQLLARSVLEARQPRSHAKWEAPTLHNCCGTSLAYFNLVRAQG